MSCVQDMPIGSCGWKRSRTGGNRDWGECLLLQIRRDIQRRLFARLAWSPNLGRLLCECGSGLLGQFSCESKWMWGKPFQDWCEETGGACEILIRQCTGHVYKKLSLEVKFVWWEERMTGVLTKVGVFPTWLGIPILEDYMSICSMYYQWSSRRLAVVKDLYSYCNEAWN